MLRRQKQRARLVPRPPEARDAAERRRLSQQSVVIPHVIPWPSVAQVNDVDSPRPAVAQVTDVTSPRPPEAQANDAASPKPPEAQAIRASAPREGQSERLRAALQLSHHVARQVLRKPR